MQSAQLRLEALHFRMRMAHNAIFFNYQAVCSPVETEVGTLYEFVSIEHMCYRAHEYWFVQTPAHFQLNYI